MKPASVAPVTRSRRQVLSLLLGAAGSPACFSRSTAQTYPSRPIRLIVPFPPGGVNDTVARPWAEKMRDQLGPIIIENIGGAGGAVGAAAAARSNPDGYSLLLAPEGTLLITPIASKRPTYDWNSFEPIAILVKSAVGFVIHPSAPFRSLKDVASFAKSKPGAVSYATAGVGTSNHLVGELFKSLAGVPDLVHVPYRGAGPALNDLVAGQVQLGTVVVTGAVLELHRTKKLNLIAVSSRTRLQAAPDVPTAVDEGFANLIWAGFHGVFAPTKTSPDIITRLGNASRVIMGEKAFQTFLLESGLEPESNSSPQELRRVLLSEVERWTPVIKGIGLQLE
jgi:tripartite-type tricarboxylate transporter receptor subunit TctC